MKNLKSIKVEELSYSSSESINGGSWLGVAVGKMVGAMVRYSGPAGQIYMTLDYAASQAE